MTPYDIFCEDTNALLDAEPYLLQALHLERLDGGDVHDLVEAFHTNVAKTRGQEWAAKYGMFMRATGNLY